MPLFDLIHYRIDFSNRLAKLRSIYRFVPFDTSTAEGRSKERYRRVCLTAAGSIVSKGVTALTGLISVPLTVHYLGVERYGLWMTISSLIAFMAFADLGLGNGLLNAISKSDGEENRESAVVAISSSFFMLLFCSISLATILSIVYPWVQWGEVFNVTSDIAKNESGPALAILALAFLLNMPLGIVPRIQMGYQEGYVTQLWMSLGAVLGLLGVLFVIFLEGGLPWLVLAISCGPLLTTVLNGVQLFISKPHLLPKWKYFSYSNSRKLLAVGAVFFLLQAFTLIGNSLDNIVISHYLGAAAVASYAVAKKLFLTVQLSQFVIQPLWPAFGEALARKDFFWAKKTLIRMIRYSALVGLVVTLPLLVWGQSVIGFWVGPQLIPTGSLLLGFFFWTFLVNYGGVMSVFLNHGQLLNKQCIFIAGAAVSSVFFQILLVNVLGVSGVIWGILLGHALFYVVPAYRLAFNYLDRNLSIVSRVSDKYA